jgi:hypothetical protein
MRDLEGEEGWSHQSRSSEAILEFGRSDAGEHIHDGRRVDDDDVVVR